MPEGCGTWPAAWEVLESNWPNSGEIDIVEGADNESPNLSSLHTSANCTMPSSNRAMTGSALFSQPPPAAILISSAGLRKATTVM